MRRKFNDTGLCIPEKHYMADTSAKLTAIIEMVEEGAYFTINRPRQYGKTTIIHHLFLDLSKRRTYLPIQISFEGIGDTVFENEASFCKSFLNNLAHRLRKSHPKYQHFLHKYTGSTHTFDDLSKAIEAFIDFTHKHVVLMIDEVDKASDNQLFLSFLGMLRDKYLDTRKNFDSTFQSVILAGIHDIKSLKLRISPDSAGKLNSPWNIAVDFSIDMSFNLLEIKYMLEDYNNDRRLTMDISSIAERIHYYSSGYPYLVSKLCKVVDEVFLKKNHSYQWSTEAIDQAFQYLVNEAYTTTLFDDIAKNLENNSQLYQLVFELSFNGKRIPYNVLNPTVNLAQLYGIIKNNSGYCQIHNRIFEQKIYAYILSKQQMKESPHIGTMTSKFYTDGGLDMPTILLSFQQFMRENYSNKDASFLEREGRLLFLSFLKPIINGKGFDFKEPTVAEERRMDIVITYGAERYVVELKRWEGEAYHQKGLKQLSDYLDNYQLEKGFLLIFDFRKHKEYREENIQFKEKEIYTVWV